MAPPADAPRPKLGLVTWLALLWIALVVLGTLLAPILPIADPQELGIRTRERERFESPGWNAFFGADRSGRDLFSLMLHGGRPSLLLALVVTLVSATIGGIVGVVAGYLRGRTDAAIMALTDMALAFPGLILVAGLTGTLGREVWVLVLGFTVLGLPPYIRIVRGVSLAISEREFVEAAEAMGASRIQILRREILPLAVLPVIAFAFLGFALVIAAEGGLAFIGLSLDQDTWGTLTAEGARDIQEAPHLALIPATIMFLTILSLNLISDRLSELRAPGGRDGTGEPDTFPVPPTPDDPDLLTISELRTQLVTERGVVKAVDGVDLRVREGTTLGVVGESGSGKTMLLRSILGAFPLVDARRSGRIDLDSRDLLTIDDATRRSILGTEIGVVSQNPLSALNPVRTIGSQITEPMRVHRRLGKGEARTRALELLDQVGIPEPDKRFAQYPHELSGGMRQRVTIAIALANEPRLLLADEPTTALDVTIQDQILKLLQQLQDEREMAVVLVTHDLAVVRGWADDVAVMYAGQVVETGPASAVFDTPRMRYTEALLESTPRLDQDVDHLATIDGQPPSLIDPPTGCRFAPRCSYAQDRCRIEAPPLVAADDPGHVYACWFPVGHPSATRRETEVAL
ncbi:MAG: dipeptide/oligopeptide/nickel ABC transporter permease/ATP-binding protein [Actinomycetota bacterium]